MPYGPARSRSISLRYCSIRCWLSSKVSGDAERLPRKGSRKTKPLNRSAIPPTTSPTVPIGQSQKSNLTGCVRRCQRDGGGAQRWSVGNAQKFERAEAKTVWGNRVFSRRRWDRGRCRQLLPHSTVVSSRASPAQRNSLGGANCWVLKSQYLNIWHDPKRFKKTTARGNAGTSGKMQVGSRGRASLVPEDINGASKQQPKPAHCHQRQC